MTVRVSGDGVKSAPVTQAERNAERKRRRHEAAAKGMCGQCTIRPAASGRAWCLVCIDRSKFYEPYTRETKYEFKCKVGCGTLIPRDSQSHFCPACWRKGIPQLRRKRAGGGFQARRFERRQPKRPEDRIILTGDDFEGIL